MIKQLLTIYSVVGMSLYVIGCDVCGNFMGITPYSNQNSISFLHRYRVFNGYRHYQNTSQFFPANAYRAMHGSPNNTDSSKTITNTYSSKDFESYKVFELRAKYFVANRIEINAFIPVLNNKSKSNGVYQTNTGLGDISLNTAYHIIVPKPENKIKHKLLTGIGLKLPTGNYNVKRNNVRLDFDLQTGTGTFDGFIYANYVIMAKRLGFNINANYKINGTNKFEEKVNNSTTNFASVFYKFNIKNIILYPSVQANYEFTKGLEINHKLDYVSGVNSLMLGPGLDLYYKRISINTLWQFSAYEEIYPNELQLAGRIVLGLNYNF